jgi:hypothetical protein
MIRRYLAGVWSVLRMIPATMLCTVGALGITFTAIAMPRVSPLGSLLVAYGAYRSLRRYQALYSWKPWKP